MIIKKLGVSNFKSFSDFEIDFGRFNVLIGANAAGKSNLVQVFRFIRDIEAFGLDNAISLQGGVEYIRNLKIGSDKNLSLSIVVGPDDEESPERTFFGPFLIGTGKNERIGVEVYEMTYEFSLQFYKRDLRFKVVKDELTQKCTFVRFVEKQQGKKKFLEKREELGKGELTYSQANGRITSKLKVPDGVPLSNRDIYNPPLIHIAKPSTPTVLLERPYRFLPFAGGIDFSGIGIYDFDPKLPKKATPITGKAELEEDGSNLAIVLKNIIDDADRRKELANLVKELLPFVQDVGIEKFADKSLLFKLQEVYAEATYLPASLISDGTINITALIIALFFERKPIVIIEEPERNIHPHLISKVVGMMQDASRRKQIIVSTHNPEMVRNANLDDIFLVSRTKEGYSTTCKPVEQEAVRIFLENEMGIDELYVENLLENCHGIQKAIHTG